MKKLILILSIAAIAIVLAGCKSEKQAKPDDKLSIVTTVGMITDIVTTIAGDHATIYGLMGPGVDPHLYKASHGDVERLSKADVIFYNGLHLEGKMSDVLKKMSRTKNVVAVSDGIPRDRLRQPPEFEGHYDPHVWMVPDLWIQTLDIIAGKLAELQPQHAAIFRSRSDSLRQVLAELDEWAAAELVTIPESQRVLITAHDAFGYFGDAYSVEVRGLQGISTATDYGLADVTDLVMLISDRNIQAVFVESSVPTKPLEAVIEGCKARGHDVKIGGTLFSDAMGELNTPEGTYVGMIRHNVKTIVEHLQ